MFQFWKYNEMLISGSEKRGDSGSVSSLGIPLVYNNRYRINLTLVTKHAEDFIRHGRLIGIHLVNKVDGIFSLMQEEGL